MIFFEDIRIGDRSVLGRHTFTAADIKSFAVRYDPQPFHTDEAAAASSHFGGLCASGWHSAIIFMRLLLDSRRQFIERTVAPGERVGQIGPGLGLRDLKWLRPVYAGDTLEYAAEVVHLRVSRSRPRFGLMTMRISGTNQNGQLAISFFTTTLVERRSID